MITFAPPSSRAPTPAGSDDAEGRTPPPSAAAAGSVAAVAAGEAAGEAAPLSPPKRDRPCGAWVSRGQTSTKTVDGRKLLIQFTLTAVLLVI